ncbi:hypothetical protein SOVF_175400 [Spinacia oleracea]|nr:hypothetical protein SOVF_175400 [Spinacia oleracea]
MIRRARRALAALQGSVVMDEKENTGNSTERSWSFGKRTSGASSKDRHHGLSFKSLSLLRKRLLGSWKVI